MKKNKHIFDVVDSGLLVGTNKPCGRVTIEPDWQLQTTESIWGGSMRGPFRYWKEAGNNQVEVELPNIQSIQIERSLSQDLATCKISMYNQWHEQNGAVPELVGQLGKPGYFWPERGASEESQLLWNQFPASGALFKDGTIDTEFDWTNCIVPNALLRTYQGFGGHDLSIQGAIDADKISITGVWLIDRISGGTDGMLQLECRDVGRLLLEQMIYPPLVPPALYPLEYYPQGTSAFDSPWGPQPTIGDANGVTEASFSEVRLFYKESSTDVAMGGELGDDIPILGHKPSDAADGNIDNYALSFAVPTAAHPFAVAYWEFWVGTSDRTIDYIYPSAPPPNVEVQLPSGTQIVVNGIVRINAGKQYTCNNSRLVMQADGNLVLYSGIPAFGGGSNPIGPPGSYEKAVWSSGTHGNPGAYAIFDTHLGNLYVLSQSGRPLWTAIEGMAATTVVRTGTGPCILALQHDHNLVIYGRADADGNRKPLWETRTWYPLSFDTDSPNQRINSVAFTPWAGGYTAYISVWDLQKGDWHTTTSQKVVDNVVQTTPNIFNGVPYAGKIDTALRLPDGMENELVVKFDKEILTNRIRITYGGPWYYTNPPDDNGNHYRSGLRTIQARAVGKKADEFSGDPNDMPWTYAFAAHPVRGYWVTDREGYTYGFGDAANYDSSSFGSVEVASAGPYRPSKELFRADAPWPPNTYRRVSARLQQPWVPPRNWPYPPAKWITDNEGTNIDAFADSIRYFKRTLNINGNATLYFTCDNATEVFLDGDSVGRSSEWLVTYSAQLGNLTGSHELKFKTQNYADDGEIGMNPTALIWVLYVNGSPVAWSDAQTQVAAYGNFIVDMAAHPDGKGYWLLDRWGQIFEFGSADHFGEVPLGQLDLIQNSNGNWTFSGDNGINFGISGKQAIGIAATPSGNGYWVMFTDGHIYGFGDARTDDDGNQIGIPIPDNTSVSPGWDWPEGEPPNRVILPAGPMTGPMISQPVPYIVKVPERNPLGYRLKEYPGSAYSYARRGTALCAHPTKRGFWATDGSGQVWAYGACPRDPSTGRSAYGELKQRTYNAGSADSFSLELFDWPHAIESTVSGNGYWIAFGSGKIAAFGDAVSQGPIDIFKDNPQIKISYSDDLGNDWTYERNQVWGLARDRDGTGFWILQADGSVRSYKADSWGQPGYYGFSGLRWHDGNFDDYSDIVKDIAAWCGFTAYDPDNEAFTAEEPKARPPVWGNIEKTGIYSDSKLPGDKWDKRTSLDCINEVKQIVGYSFWIDDEGFIRFETPNWWRSGNLDVEGRPLYRVFNEDGSWDWADMVQEENEQGNLEWVPEDPDAEQFIPEISEAVNLINYSASLDGGSYASEIIVGSDQPDFKHPNSPPGYVRFYPKSSNDEIRPGVPALRNIVRTFVWTDTKLTNREEQEVSTELINLQIWFGQRVGNVTTVANPNIQINDQIRILERNTSETYVHFVRGISSSMNLETGEYMMTLQTNRLGTADNWVITTSGEYNPINQISISEKVDRWQQNTGRGLPSLSTGTVAPTFVGSFIRR